jgi:hypothetical protein
VFLHGALFVAKSAPWQICGKYLLETLPTPRFVKLRKSPTLDRFITGAIKWRASPSNEPDN